MFKNAKVGDKVFNYLYQRWETITDIRNNEPYPIVTFFNEYTYSGKEFVEDVVPTLFWGEVKPITPPEKPLPKLKVDTKVLVFYGSEKVKRYFSHFNDDNKMECFINGTTSWTTNGDTVVWDNWELA